MVVPLDDSCVYTIATSARLLEASKFQMPLYESKRWIRAEALLKNAHNADLNLPIVFADSRDCSKLFAWSVLRSVSITAKGTHYTIGKLWSVPRSSPQDLQLLNSKRHIADGFIRPYALCQTPRFLQIESKQPQPWLQRSIAIREVREGNRRLVAHMRLERNHSIVNTLKKERMQQHNGRLPCDVCGFDFLAVYGPIGAGFAEAHHKTSLAGSPKHGRITSLDDFAMVCANCHRMLHRTPELPSIESLRTRAHHLAQKTQQGAPADATKGRA